MKTGRYIPLSANADNVALQDRMPITLREKIIIGGNAAAAALGTTFGLFIEGLWYLTSDVASGGLGVSLVGSAAIVALSTVTVFSLLATVPIMILTYRELISEAESLQSDLRREAATRSENQEKMFFEVMRLRCLFNNAEDFTAHALPLLQLYQAEVDVESLFKQVNRLYKKLSTKQYSLAWSVGANLLSLLREDKTNPATQSFIRVMRNTDLLSNPAMRNELLQDMADGENLQQHFHDIPAPAITNRSTAIGYGVIAGISVAGFGVGAGWAFGAIAIGAGIAAAIPVAGWIALAVSCLVLGAVFGAGVGICKQKNIQRKALVDRVSQGNELLATGLQAVKDAYLHAHEIKKAINNLHENQPKNNLINLPLAVNSDEFKGLNFSALLSPRLPPTRCVDAEQEATLVLRKK